MFGFLKNLFGPKVDFADLMAKGAVIVDVRTKGEFQGGHVKGSINIPLDQLANNLKKINKDKPVITVCASGARSSSARGLLMGKGYTEVYNGGSWINMRAFGK